MLLLAIVAVSLAAYSYRARALRPDLSISAADVAWATDSRIWKIDLTDVGEIYGFQVVVFEKGGSTKRWICRLGGYERMNIGDNPLVMVCARSDEGTVTGKLASGGGSTSFKINNFLQGDSVSSAFRPALDNDLYYLMSDSDTVGFGKVPFSKTSNKIALELLRAPVND